MKKTKFWTTPEVHFICGQEKPNEKKAPWAQVKVLDSGVSPTEQYQLRLIV